MMQGLDDKVFDAFLERVRFNQALDAEFERESFDESVRPERFYAKVADRLGVLVSNPFRTRCRKALLERHGVASGRRNGAAFLRLADSWSRGQPQREQA